MCNSVLYVLDVEMNVTSRLSLARVLYIQCIKKRQLKQSNNRADLAKSCISVPAIHLFIYTAALYTNIIQRGAT